MYTFQRSEEYRGGELLEASPPSVAKDETFEGPIEVDRNFRICLAASGGGHLRQLFDLEPVWSQFDHFFVTEDTALGQSILGTSRTYFVPHVALGQARLGRPFKMLAEGFRNMFGSLRLIMRERPDAVITTGAGAVFFATLFARLLGAQVIMIDSFARFDKPSVFARVVAPIAQFRVVQSKTLANAFRKVKVFDPLRVLNVPRPEKQALVFATVGATLPFDRLVKTVASAKKAGLLPERVVAQVGDNGLHADGLETIERLSFREMHAMLDKADIVVCHGGTGSLITALQHGCRVIVIPRQFRLGEHYDDHQMEISSAFRDRGLIQMARTEEEFAEALANARRNEPVTATTDNSELRVYLNHMLAAMARH
jgi:UDP-N-acetylglucosamine transferase subunit ALG13